MSPYFVGVHDLATGETTLDPSAPPEAVAPHCWKRQQNVHVDRHLVREKKRGPKNRN